MAKNILHKNSARILMTKASAQHSANIAVEPSVILRGVVALGLWARSMHIIHDRFLREILKLVPPGCFVQPPGVSAVVPKRSQGTCFLTIRLRKAGNIT